MNKNGFTLIELLAVIIILGVLMIIAIPSVTTYISNSRKSSYVDTAKNLISSGRNMVNNGKLDMFDRNATYYLPVSCLPSENGAVTPYGKFTIAYVVAVYNGEGYKYYFTGTDSSHTGINKLVSFDNLKPEDIETEVEDTDIKNDIGIGERESIVLFNGDCTSFQIMNAQDMADNDGNLIPGPQSFATDSWSTIIRAVKNNNTSMYNVGDTKEVDLGEFGVHTVRIANKSVDDRCEDTNYTETACGFVIEFTDIISKHEMGTKAEYMATGYPGSTIRSYLNNDIYNALPKDLQSGIINTRVISGFSMDDETTYTTMDKIYLLSANEVWSAVPAVSQEPFSWQLDYYRLVGADARNYSRTIKKYQGTNYAWWTRYSSANFSELAILGVDTHYSYNTSGFQSTANLGVSPALRIG